MASPDLKYLLALDVQTRIALVQALWDSIVNDAQAASLPMSELEQRELQDRLREDDADPDGAIPWATARATLRTDR